MNLEISPKAKEIPACPVCHKSGQSVKKITVEHQVLPNVELNQEQFFLCRTPECEVAYYTSNSQFAITQNQLINKIWFKNIPSPIPICYCANVSEEEILQHIAVTQCCSNLEDIKKHTGANTGCECITKNPAGG